MAKVYTEKEVIDRLRKEIAANKPLFCPNCGCGLTAKLQAMGGADVICVSATSYWRLKGQGSLAPLMPYSDINKCIMSIVPEVVMNAGDVPVVTLSGGTNPLLPHRKHLEMLREMGVSGINPFMMNIYGEHVMKQMEKIGMGWSKEVDFVHEAHEMDMFTLAYAFTPEEAKILTEAGASAIASHCGTTTGGLKGAVTDFTLDDAAKLSQEIFDAAKEVNPDIITFAHGGPIEGPAEAKYIFEHTDAHGFIGGSAAERMPIEKAVLAATKEYKEIEMPAR
ncbi:MAG: phosphoenolpyruvate hydrolase family protein [Christensenellaceae bacterium]|nr:phosphoenolpyruvate hydrolase family protein [Christensenellaceae bacterium]